MKTYPMDSPPDEPGLYTITNRITGQLYIGRSVRLRRRYNEWKSVFSTGLGGNIELAQAVTASGPENWDFTVLMVVPGAGERELEQLERRAVVRVAAQRPKDILNSVVAAPPVAMPAVVGSVAKSVVIHEGPVLTHAQVAAMLGVKPQAVKKRLRNWRARGIFETTLGALM